MLSGLPFLSRRRRSVLSRAVARWRAGNYNATLDALVDESGNGLHARLGSAVGADSNDPLRLPFSDGGKRIYFPGSTTNYQSTPDNAAFDPAADFEIEAYALPTSWANTDRAIVSKYAASGWYWRFNTANTMQLVWGSGGSAQVSTVGQFTEGVGSYIKVACDVDTGAGQYGVSFYKSSDGLNWTQIGATQTGASTTIADTGHALQVGALNNGSGSLWAGVLDKVRLRNGIGGSTVASIDAASLSEPYATYTDPQGNVWTLNRSASGRKLCVVDRDLLLLGTDDYMEVADSPLLNFSANQSFTVALIARRYGNNASTVAWISKDASTAVATAGYYLEGPNANNTMRLTVSDGTDQMDSNSVTPAPGVMQMVAAVMNRSSNQMQTYAAGTLSAGVTPTNVDSLVNALAMQIGKLGTSYIDMEFVGGAIFREPVSAADLRRLAREMGVSA